MSEWSVRKTGKRVESLLARLRQWCVVRYLLLRAGGRDVATRYAEAAAADGEPLEADAPVWVCWWQGEAAMPAIVKACVASIRRHAGTHPVRLVTRENYARYASMPPFVVGMLESGRMDLTHFSDILRMQLLRRHGGIWMDATVLLPAKDLADIVRTGSRFWTCRHRPTNHNVARGGWTSFFLACGRGCVLPAVVADLHIAYWRRHRRLVDYLLLDYCFAVARRTVSAVAELVESVPLTAMGPLGRCLTAPFDREEWDRFCREYDFHKLSYKTPPRRFTPDGRKTYYGHVLEAFLDGEKNIENTEEDE